MLQKQRSKGVGLFLSLLLGGGLVLIPLESMAQQRTPPPSGWADTVVVNGKVATMNDGQKFVEALAVRGDRLVAVGTRPEVEKFAGPQTKVIDVKGRTVIPGLVGSHEHPHLWVSLFHNTGAKFNPQWQWVGAIGDNPQEAASSIQRIIQREVPKRKPGDWILIRTDEDGGRAISDKLITPEVLDKVAPNNPVCVDTDPIDYAIGKNGNIIRNNEAMWKSYEGYGPPLRLLSGPSILNSTGRQAYEAEALASEIYKNLGMGSWLQGCMLSELDLWIIPNRVGYETFAEAIRQELQFWIETQGVTTHVTTWFRHPSVLSAFSILARQKKMPARLGWYTWGEHHLFGDQTGVGDPFLWNAGVEYEPATVEEYLVAQRDPSFWGTELEGAITLKSTLPLKDARLEKVRADFTQSALLALPGTAARESIMKWLRQGIGVRDVHGYSDGAVDMFIDILRQLQRETGWSDDKIAQMRNFFMVHNSLVRPEQIPFLKKYGMSISPSLRNITELIGLKKAYGEEVKKYTWPVKSLTDAGVIVAPSLDMSPTFGPDGEGVWDLVEFLVDREYAKEEWNKAEAVDRWTALKTMTLNGAWVALRENELGSLEVGKFADLVVLDKDYFTIPVKEIGTITPLLTMVGGKVVFQKATF